MGMRSLVLGVMGARNRWESLEPIPAACEPLGNSWDPAFIFNRYQFKFVFLQ